MDNKSLARIVRLQKDVSSIRNVCILAHIDHGKTTLADSLISSNGIISHWDAGELKYMDSREDEQEKGITMKASSISLYYCSEANKEYLVNLIDSPGHIDFYGEVSTAVRLCDGVIVVVDVVQGVCPQTHAALRQAWMHNMKSVLVFNKMDRMILELQLTPKEAETRLMNLLGEVNAVIGELYSRGVHAKSAREAKKTQDTTGIRDKFDLDEWSTGLEDHDDSHLYFSPEHGNVVFGSAIDGWGFRVSNFASMCAKKLKLTNEDISIQDLSQSLWGDFYFDPTTKKIKKGAQNDNKKTLFVKFILESIWNVYDAVRVKKNITVVEKIIEFLRVKVSLKGFDSKETLRAIFRQWLPLSNSVLEMVSQHVPDPSNISEERVMSFLKGSASIDSVPMETMSLKKDILNCNSSQSSPTVVFVSKMFPVELTSHVQYQLRAQQAMIDALSLKQKGVAVTLPKEKSAEEKAQELIAFARIFSGTIKKGQSLYLFGRNHDPNDMKDIDLESDDIEEKLKSVDVTKIQVDELYLLMGKDLQPVDEVPAGNILGIGGLSNSVIKSVTMSDNLFCPSFSDTMHDVSPIVRVAIYSKHIADLDKLIKGLDTLNRCDPCVEVCRQSTGEFVLGTVGEVHLCKCLDDLTKRFAQVVIEVSSPIIPFRETIVPSAQNLNNKLKSKREQKESQSVDISTDSWQLRVRAVPLSTGVVNLLTENSHLLKLCNKKFTEVNYDLDAESLLLLMTLKMKLGELSQDEMGLGDGFVNNVWSVDPGKDCTNLLINQVDGYERPSFWDLVNCNDGSLKQRLKSLDRSVIVGFEMACKSGPLCQEPMSGVCFVVEKWSEVLKPSTDVKAVGNGNKLGENSGEDNLDQEEDKDEETNEELEEIKVVYKVPIEFSLISCMTNCCRRAFQAQPQRLMWAMYACVIQTDSEVLGKVYHILRKRYGEVLSEDLIEGSSLFQVDAAIPVVESFGFAEEFRRETSGFALTHLKFSHWKVIDVDPYWIPNDEEDATKNIAKKYMNDIRKRKGLKTDEKLVEFAEKQRTLTKNK